MCLRASTSNKTLPRLFPWLKMPKPCHLPPKREQSSPTWHQYEGAVAGLFLSPTDFNTEIHSKQIEQGRSLLFPPAARMSGVAARPLVGASTGDPLSSRRSNRERWPAMAAQCRGISPSQLLHCTAGKEVLSLGPELGVGRWVQEGAPDVNNSPHGLPSKTPETAFH